LSLEIGTAETVPFQSSAYRVSKVSCDCPGATGNGGRDLAVVHAPIHAAVILFATVSSNEN
jgi:hypothetical protein